MASTFKFDLKTPLQTGTLSKQGRVTRKFIKRFFVLYPDFLVYYDDSRKWNRDVWRRSLSCRSGAVYLKNATCIEADEEFQFSFLVATPDPRNKQQRLVLRASTKDEQCTWIDAISGAIPHKDYGFRFYVPPQKHDLDVSSGKHAGDVIGGKQYLEGPVISAMDVGTYTSTEHEADTADRAIRGTTSGQLDDTTSVDCCTVWNVYFK